VFDFLSVWLKPRRQLEGFSQPFRRLVDGEPRRIGSEFKQNTSRFPKVNGAEVAAIEHRGDVQMFVHQPPPPGLL